MTGWVVDHVFVFVAAEMPEAAALTGLGLVESFRRHHPGQGTANACFCFDNAYLELLWIADAAEAASCDLARAGLAARADWHRSGASPLGVALRHPDPAAIPPFPCWNYATPFLPGGMTIPVATASDDPRQPLLFRSPGNARPDQWRDGRAGARQKASGLAEIAHVRLLFPDEVTPHPAFVALDAAGAFEIGTDGAASMLELALARGDGAAPRLLRLPEATVRGYE